MYIRFVSVRRSVPPHSTFLPPVATLFHMEATYGSRLQAARKLAGYKRQADLAEIIGVSSRTVRNWETDANLPDPAMRQNLRMVLGKFDVEGDPVEVAVRQSELTVDRQHAVIGCYLKHLREQGESNVS